MHTFDKYVTTQYGYQVLMCQCGTSQPAYELLKERFNLDLPCSLSPSEEVKLELCPFCSSAQVALNNVSDFEDREPRYFIWCEQCGAEGPKDYVESKAETLWNSRA